MVSLLLVANRCETLQMEFLGKIKAISTKMLKESRKANKKSRHGAQHIYYYYYFILKPGNKTTYNNYTGL